MLEYSTFFFFFFSFQENDWLKILFFFPEQYIINYNQVDIIQQ